MQRLVTFGCSMTYGQSLETSEHAWPSVVATHFNVPLANQGVCGNSNLAILNDVLKFNFLDGDAVVVMWSFTGRDLLFGKTNFFSEQQTTPIGVWQDTSLSNSWAQVHPESDIATRTWLYVHHASLYLKSIGVTAYNVFADYSKVKKYKPKYLNLEFYKIKTRTILPPDKASDNMHPGPKTHNLIASEIIKIIK